VIVGKSLASIAATATVGTNIINLTFASAQAYITPGDYIVGVCTPVAFSQVPLMVSTVTDSTHVSVVATATVEALTAYNAIWYISGGQSSNNFGTAVSQMEGTKVANAATTVLWAPTQTTNLYQMLCQGTSGASPIAGGILAATTLQAGITFAIGTTGTAPSSGFWMDFYGTNPLPTGALLNQGLKINGGVTVNSLWVGTTTPTPGATGTSPDGSVFYGGVAVSVGSSAPIPNTSISILNAQSTPVTNYTSSTWVSLTGNAVTLTAGTWELHGNIFYGGGATPNGIIALEGQWSTANGTGTGTPPAAATLKAGFNPLVNNILFNTNGQTSGSSLTLNLAGSFPMQNVLIAVSGTTNIYLVPQSFTLGSNSALYIGANLWAELVSTATSRYWVPPAMREWFREFRDEWSG
jgi:hypothetical protein